MKKSLLVFILFCFSTILAQNSELPTNQNVEPRNVMMNSHDSNLKSFPQESFYKRKADWQYTIDTTWGLGLSTAEKLQVFDTYWNKFDQTWGGFPNLNVNWDSLKNVYRPLVQAGVSRGRFYGILSRMSHALNEWHSWIKDPGVDSIFGIYYSQYGGEIEYPNFESFHYEPGIPLLNLSPVFRSNFGAGVTALQDSIALIYSVMTNHPLNLQLGDIVLGYDGLPWRENLKDLLNQELPLLFGGGYSAASLHSMNHANVISVGLNWGLFDTIDILKYSTGDTLHYPTSLLSSINQPYFICTEQLPVNGVPFPNLNQNNMVSWGVVDGTTIGYIYVWDWYEQITQTLFGQSVDELMHQQNVTGLIIDLRVHQGGEVQYANDGFKQLFNVDPTSNFSGAVRVPGNDHFLFNLESPWSFFFFTPTSEIFDHPIAVLTGPFCGSAGDYNAFRMRFHPMARFFGKKAATAYTYINGENRFSSYNYKFRVDNGSLYSNFNNEAYLIHKGFPVDEEIWLTRDGVANGIDNVVQRALTWINNKVYPHDTYINKFYYKPTLDSIHIFTNIENPNSHQLSAKAYIHKIDNTLTDSVNFFRTFTNQQTEQWRADLGPMNQENFYKVSVTVTDETDLDHVKIPYVTRFTTAGPVKLDSIVIKKQFSAYSAKLYLHNFGSTVSIANGSVKLICNDPWVTNLSSAAVGFPILAPGTSVSSGSILFSRMDSLFPNYYNFKVEVMSDGWKYWIDSITVVTEIDDEVQQPLTFKLEQNYPNPFNPSTRIQYQVSSNSHVSLNVYDVLGNEIATLVNEEKETGSYEVEWNARDKSSGVYFYQLKAGEFIATKKMIFLR